MSGTELSPGEDDRNETEIQAISLGDRDPNHLHDDLARAVEFQDIFGEPEPSVYSHEKIWTLSYQLFATVKLWTYRVLTLVLALPCSIWWGFVFSLVAFCHIWCYTPWIRSCRIDFGCIRQVLDMALTTIFAPVVDVLGRLLYHIRITRVNRPSVSFSPDPESGIRIA